MKASPANPLSIIYTMNDNLNKDAQNSHNTTNLTGSLKYNHKIAQSLGLTPNTEPIVHLK